MNLENGFSAFNISARGMSIQKKRMELITENIANTNTTKTTEGGPYKRKFLRITDSSNFNNVFSQQSMHLRLRTTNADQIEYPNDSPESVSQSTDKIKMQVVSDNLPGEKVYMPDHPDADKNGYVQMPNVNIVTEMINMITASRSFESNLTAFNASKQIAKDSLEI